MGMGAYDSTNSVRVFIGSSFKLMGYRNSIGDMLRRLNDRWEQHGVRLLLRRWEDFRTEYENKSKQQEYIDELVLPSDICVFVYGDRVGEYTEKELDAAIKAGNKQLYCYRVPDKNGVIHTEVETKIVGKGQPVIDMGDINQLVADLQQKIEAYIQDGHVHIQNTLKQMNCYWFYTTIPDDNKEVTGQFGTTIRSLDDFCEENLSVRCRLHPMGQKDLLAATDHYIPYLKKQTSDVDLEEFDCALSILKKSQLKAITLFVRPKSGLPDSNKEISGRVKRRDLFTCTVRGDDTIRWRLLSWVMKEQKMVLTATTPGVEMRGMCLMMNGKPMVSASDLDETGNVAKLVAQKENLTKEIDEMLSGAVTTTDQEITKRVKQRNMMEATLMLQISECLMKAMFQVWNDDMSSKEEMDIEQIETIAGLAEQSLESTRRTEEQLVCMLEAAIRNVNERIEEQSNRPINNDGAIELEKLAALRVKLTRQLVEHGKADASQLLGIQLFLIGIHDTYLHPGISTAEEDAIFKMILDDAERYGTQDIMVEVIRMNYGNSFLRMGDHETAITLFNEALKRIGQQESEAWHTLRIKSTIYLRIYTAYRERDDHEGMTNVLDLFNEHTLHCLSLGNRHIADRAMYLSALMTSYDIEQDAEVSQLKEAMSVADFIDQHVEIPETDQWFGEICIQFPNMIAGYLIDHGGGIIDKRSKELIDLIIHYLDICEKNAALLMRVNLREGLFYQGEVNHQKGFLYYLLGPNSWHKSEACYQTALESKERQMQLEPNFSTEISIANTLVNWGAVGEGALQLSEQLLESGIKVLISGSEAESKAKRALAIYEKYMQAGYVQPRQHYYEALQLLGTIKYHRGRIIGDKEMKQAGLAMLLECWKWNVAHPKNSYRKKFEANAGSILREEHVI